MAINPIPICSYCDRDYGDINIVRPSVYWADSLLANEAPELQAQRINQEFSTRPGHVMLWQFPAGRDMWAKADTQEFLDGYHDCKPARALNDRFCQTLEIPPSLIICDLESFPSWGPEWGTQTALAHKRRNSVIQSCAIHPMRKRFPDAKFAAINYGDARLRNHPVDANGVLELQPPLTPGCYSPVAYPWRTGRHENRGVDPYYLAAIDGAVRVETCFGAGAEKVYPWCALPSFNEQTDPIYVNRYVNWLVGMTLTARQKINGIILFDPGDAPLEEVRLAVKVVNAARSL